MRDPRPNLILKQLRQLVGHHRKPDGSDRELLERFAQHQDQDAFADLLQRHGPMVLRTIKRELPFSPDADDAFQATFLVLARKAASLRGRESVAGWLHHVGRHLALKARTAAARRQKHESRAGGPAPVDPLAELSVREAQAVLDAELDALAEKYRLPLVLCYLQGATRDEAAKRLNLSQATLDRRLHRGRELLRHRLTRHGLTFAVALEALHLMAAPAAAMSVQLLDRTAAAAAAFAAGCPVSALASAQAITLAEEGIKMTGTFSLKFLSAVVVGLGLLGTGAALALQKLSEPPGPIETAVVDPQPKAIPEKDAPRKEDAELIQGTWKVSSLVVDGIEAAKDIRDEIQVILDRGTMTIKPGLTIGGPKIALGGPDGDVVDYVIDPSQALKHLDLASEGPGNKLAVKGIYELDGDDLKICYGSADRPKEFTSNKGSGIRLFVLRRQPPGQEKKDGN